MLALVDGDLIAYRCAASLKEGENLDIVVQRADQLSRTILDSVGASEYTMFLTGSDNFRKVINPEYKANRKDQVPPEFLQDVREFLVTEWKAKLGHGLEADDLLGIHQTEDSIICSLDKDLRMIPGWHHSWEIGTVKWVKPAETVQVDQTSADKHFWKQMLIGDKTDNIIGVDGIGPVKAGKAIDPCETNQECMEVVLSLYGGEYNRFVMNANCLWIKRNEESTWLDLNLILTSELQHEQDMMCESMKSFIQSI